jgi:hypothetical protein
MKRKSPASMGNPWPTGVAAWACTVDTNKGPPTDGDAIATVITIAHRLTERTRRPIKYLDRVMNASDAVFALRDE